MNELTWTTGFPTKLGYYWIRNLRYKRGTDDPAFSLPMPQIVDLDQNISNGNLAIFFIGDDAAVDQYQVVSAEFCGPLEPPA